MNTPNTCLLKRAQLNTLQTCNFVNCFSVLFQTCNFCFIFHPPFTVTQKAKKTTVQSANKHCWALTETPSQRHHHQSELARSSRQPQLQLQRPVVTGAKFITILVFFGLCPLSKRLCCVCRLVTASFWLCMLWLEHLRVGRSLSLG